MSLYEILPGLPPYGPQALPFSATGMGTHREGFVVRFLPDDTSATWVGNFQPGETDLREILRHPDGARVIVIAGGAAYIIVPTDPKTWTHFGGSIEFAQPVQELNAILFGNGLWFELLGSEGMIWRTRRISWDGMAELSIQGLTLMGHAWGLGDTWSEFTVDLVEGIVHGGAYSGPGSPECET